ncbi:MAG: hypothetical protein IIZ59_04240 [Clostridia bacterium]|nr:hypothetical protein [Clostridia bacterium]
MSYIDDNSAYDLSLFEDAEPRAEKNDEDRKVYNISKERRRRIFARVDPLLAMEVSAVTTVVIVAMVAIIHGQVQLTVLNHEIASAQQTLGELTSAYTQIEMAVENKLGPSVIEEYAKNVLGMSKADNSQKEFISFSEGDKAVVADADTRSLFEKLYESLREAWSSDY